MLNLKKIPRNHHRKIRQVLESHVWEFFTHHNNYRGGDIGPVENIDLVMYDIRHGHAHIFQDLNSDKFVVQYAGPCQWISKDKMTHVCTMCDHKMAASEIIEFMGTTQCPNCFRDDFIVPINDEEGDSND